MICGFRKATKERRGNIYCKFSIKMKSIFYLCAFIIAMTLFSCSDDTEQSLSDASLPSKGQASLNHLTRASDSSDSLCLLEVDDSMRSLLSLRTKVGRHARKVGLAPADYDDNFNGNMFAIRELPVTIEVMEAGKNKSQRYLWCNRAGSEVKLTDNKNAFDISQQFYLKILPASSGIPYLLYSESSKTPLTVGHYRKTPNVNILMSNSKDDISNPFVGWDLKPSSAAGYFAIENEMLLGQKDPKNMWSVFNYYLEVNDNNELRFAEYTGKNQQKFFIKPIARFTVSNVSYNFEAAKVTDATPFEVKFNRVFQGDPGSEFSDKVNCHVIEKSWFQQNRSNIKFDLNTNTLLQMPTVLARKALLLDGDPNKIRYIISGYQNVYSDRECTVEGTVPHSTGKCLVSISMKLTSYNAEVPYTLYAEYNGREIKFTGTWKGVVIPNPKFVDPIITTRFFDLMTGEEILDSNAAKSFRIRK